MGALRPKFVRASSVAGKAAMAGSDCGESREPGDRLLARMART